MFGGHSLGKVACYLHGDEVFTYWRIIVFSGNTPLRPTEGTGLRGLHCRRIGGGWQGVHRGRDKGKQGRLLRDFSHKSEKHTAYLDHDVTRRGDAKEKDFLTVPNRFYYGVPKELAKEALGILKDTPYGLIYVDPEDPKLSLNGHIKVVKAFCGN